MSDANPQRLRSAREAVLDLGAHGCEDAVEGRVHRYGPNAGPGDCCHCGQHAYVDIDWSCPDDRE